MALHYCWIYDDKLPQSSGKSSGMGWTLTIRTLLRLAKPLEEKGESLSLENKPRQVVWKEGVLDTGNSPSIETRRQVDALRYLWRNHRDPQSAGMSICRKHRSRTRQGDWITTVETFPDWWNVTNKSLTRKIREEFKPMNESNAIRVYNGLSP